MAITGVPKRVEDWNKSLCNSLYSAISTELSKINVKLKAAYVVGSYCFYLDPTDIEDLDIVCIVDVTINPINGIGYNYVNNVALNANYNLRKLFDAKINLVLSNQLHGGKTQTVEGIILPSFDLAIQKLIGKSPTQQLPYHFHYNSKTKNWITFLRDKHTKYIP